MRPLAIACVICCTLLITACGDAAGRGVMITGQGKFGANNDRNQRESAQDALNEAIGSLLGTDWTVASAISELPLWVEDARGGQTQDGDWRWERITATVTLTGKPGAKLDDAKRSDIEQGSRTYLQRKLRHRDPALVALNVQVQEQAAAPAQVAVPVPVVPAVPVAPAAPAPRAYVVQPGDTIADISSAFFGSPNHWRAIVSANPGLDPASLKPGQQIIIPVLAQPVAAPAAPATPAPQ